MTRLEKIEFLKTFRSELMGFTIFISLLFSKNNLLILESVKDQVIVSKNPLDAIDL